MKIKLKDSDMWIEEEKRRRRRKLLITFLVILIIGIAAGGMFVWRYQYIKNGSYYAKVTLADTQTGQPKIYTYQGFDKVVKSPSMSYVMLAPGELVTEEDTFCVFLYENDYYAISEVTESTLTAINERIIPALGGNVVESTQFSLQEGYFNDRHIQRQCLTLSIGKGNLYTVSYRLLMPEGADILLTGISTDLDLVSTEENVKKIFQSIYQILPQKEGETQSIDYEVIGQDESNNLIGNIVVQVEHNEGVPMDEDYFPEGTPEEEIIPNPNGIHELETNVLYKSNEEKLLTLEQDFTSLAFVFSYSFPTEMTSIELYDPQGNVYYPNEKHKFLGYDYVFYVDSPQKGEWKFIWTAPDRIGDYEAYFTQPEYYTPPAELTQQPRYIPFEEE